jgi:hypothetical protein
LRNDQAELLIDTHTLKRWAGDPLKMLWTLGWFSNPPADHDALLTARLVDEVEAKAPD